MSGFRLNGPGRREERPINFRFNGVNLVGREGDTLAAALLANGVTLVGRSHATVIATLSKPLVSVLLVAAIISVAIHMRLGMQVVIEDYVHSEFRKILLLMLNTFFAWGVGLSSIFAVLKISFGP